MELVSHLSEIRENIMKIDKYLQDPDSKEVAVGLIKRGTCFIAVKKKRGHSFYPSRFIGYKNNDYHAHGNNDEKDGRETNQAINSILNQKPEPSLELEEEYKAFCGELGFVAHKKGAFGVERKYWLLAE